MFIDVHGHAYRYTYPLPDGRQAFITPEQLLKRYAESGIDVGVLLPLVSPELYLPQSVGEIIDVANQSGGRFIPFCNLDPRVIGNSPDTPLEYLLKYYRDQGCRGIGEVLPQMDMADPKMLNLCKHTEAVGFPMIIDITGCRTDGGYGLYDDHGLPQLEICLQKFPTLIIVGHGPGFWAEIKRQEPGAPLGGYPSGPVTEEGAVPRLLRQYPNLWVEVSAGSGANAIKRDPAYGIRFLNEFQDRVMFGTDVCGPNDPFRMVDYLLELRRDGKLPEAAFQKIASGNARRLLGL